MSKDKFFIYDNNKPYKILLRFSKCNFKCVFCNVNIEEGEKHWSFKYRGKELVEFLFLKFILKFKSFNLNRGNLVVDFSGGEPTLYPFELIILCKKIKKFIKNRYPHINLIYSIQTNASNIDEKIAFQLKECGFREALVSFHTIKYIKEILRVDSKMLLKVIMGISNLLKVGIEVYPNIILNKINKDEFLDILKYLIKKFPEIEIYNIGVLQPHGYALERLTDLFVDYVNIKDIYNKGIFYLKSKGKKIVNHYVGLPPCYMLTDKYNLELKENYLFFRDFYVDFLIKNKSIKLDDDLYIIFKEKKKTDKCRLCFYKKFCFGVRKEYVTLRPVTIIGDQFYKNYYKFVFLEIVNCNKLTDGDLLNTIARYIKSKGAKGIVISLKNGLCIEKIFNFLIFLIKSNYIYNIIVYIDEVNNFFINDDLDILEKLFKISSYFIINNNRIFKQIYFLNSKQNYFETNVFYLKNKDKESLKIKAFLKYLQFYNRVVI